MEDIVKDEAVREEEGSVSMDDTTYEAQKIWRKNVPWLYDVVYAMELEVEIMSLNWVGKRTSPDKNSSILKLALCTRAQKDAGFIIVGDIKVPTNNGEIDVQPYRPSVQKDIIRKKLGGGPVTQGSSGHPVISNQKFFTPKITINHKGDANKIAYMPKNPTILATKSSDASIYIFNYLRYPSNPTSKFEPDLVLVGHKSEGFAVAWGNGSCENLLASGSLDMQIKAWDLSDEVKTLNCSGNQHAGKVLQPIVTLSGHKGAVEDVKFHNEGVLLGSVGDDKALRFWDLRQKKEACSTTCSGEGELNCLAFNQQLEPLVATGSSGGEVLLWDKRQLASPFHAFQYHKSDVFGLEFMPQNGSILASSSADTKIYVYDLANIGQAPVSSQSTTASNSQENKKQENGEVLFVHCGHTGPINDFRWSPTEPFFNCQCFRRFNFPNVEAA